MTEWFDRQAGEPTAQSQDDPAMFLMGSMVPDHVRLPPQYGRTQHRVVDVYRSPCPCGASHEAITLELEGTLIRVSECPAVPPGLGAEPGRPGFLWWKPKGS